MWMNSIFMILGFVSTIFLTPMCLHLLYEGECIRKNYKGEDIPVSAGIVFIPVVVILTIFSLFFESILFSFLFLSGTLGMGLAGLMDDLLGNRNVTGLKGHIKMMFKGKLTTGGFKAAFGGLIALTVSMILSKDYTNILINTILIALFTNFINLLDLRPGRAVKGFLLSGVILLIQPMAQIFRMLLLGVMGASCAYIPYDLKAKTMMGDVGSNILGISLGITCATLSFKIRIIALIFLIGIHIYTEKYSLTKTIEKVKILKFLDELGR
ncbi:glycosyl transferase [Anaerophilus nitritogenes]|uniref:glycosyl transferase n=1 Tax=Anaerophilus nitritogenes TaxID=2498136 RepID=UPI00101BF910|nr:glycosyl transferase [Anaerophilus nitritogenes]